MRTFPPFRGVPAGFKDTPCGPRPISIQGHYGSYGTELDLDVGKYNCARFLFSNKDTINSFVGPAPRFDVKVDSDGYFESATFPDMLGHGSQGIAFRQLVTSPSVAKMIGIEPDRMAVGKLTDSRDETMLMKFLLKEQRNTNLLFSRPLPIMIPKIGAILDDQQCQFPDGTTASYTVRQDAQDLSSIPLPENYKSMALQMMMSLRPELGDAEEDAYVNSGGTDPSVVEISKRLTNNISMIRKTIGYVEQAALGAKILPSRDVFSPQSWLMVGQVRDEEDRKSLLYTLKTMIQFNLDTMDFVFYFVNKSVNVGDFEFNVYRGNFGWAISRAPSYIIDPSAPNGHYYKAGPVSRRLHLVARDLGWAKFMTRPVGARAGADSMLLFGMKGRR